MNALLLIITVFTLPVLAAVVNDRNTSPLPYSQYHQRYWNTRDNMPQVSALSIAQDNQGFIWVATEGGLARFDGHDFKVYDGSVSSLFADPLLRKVFVDPNGVIWVGTTNRLITINNEQVSEVTYHGKSLGHIEDISLFDDHIYASGGGLFKIDLETKRVGIVHADSEQVSALLVDGDRMWVAINDQLHIVSGNAHQQKYSLSDLPTRTQIDHLAIYRGDLILGTTSGLFTVDERGRASPFLVDGKAVYDPIELVFADSNENLWVAGKQRLLQIDGHKLTEEISEIDGKTSPWFATGFEDKHGDLWFGTRTHGLLRLRADNTFRLGESKGLNEPYVWSFARSERGIYSGTNAGLYLFENDRFTPVVQDERLPNHAVYSVFIDREDTFWLGTRSGLVHLSSSYAVMHRFPELANLQVNGIVQSSDGDIWVATLNGLFRWDGESLININEQWYLESKNTRYLFIDSDNSLWIGTARGVYRWDGTQLHDFSDNPLLNTASISFIEQLRDGRMVIGTFQSGFAVQHEAGWYWLQAASLPAPGVMFLAENQDNLLISSLKGLYQISMASLQPGQPANVQVIIDDFGLESDSDGLRCCNGAGNSKGLVDGNTLYLPSLNGVVSVRLDAKIKANSLALPVIDSLITRGELFHESGVTLPPAQRNVQLTYTVPQFYRNSALEFRYRLSGYDKEWSEAGARRDAFFTNLPAGDYVFEVQSRFQEMDAWSDTAQFAFFIPAFWYEEPWMRVVFLMLAVLAVWLVFHFRTLRLKRTKLQLENMVDARTLELDKANRQLAQANEQLRLATLTDSLTGLNNRRYLDAFIGKILARAERTSKSVYCILLDIDNFKVLNDTFGHAVGDDVLIRFSDILREQVRDADHLIRWGGEEFLIVVDGGTSIQAFIHRLMAALSEARWPRLGAAPTCSVGVTCHLQGMDESWKWNHSLILADKAMYLVKRSGKAGWLQLQPKRALYAGDTEVVVKLSPESLVTSGKFILSGSEHILSVVESRNDKASKLMENCEK